MINEERANAYSEVVGILDNIPASMYHKVPEKTVKIFRDGCNPNYQFKYDIYQSLEKQDVSEYAKVIIAILFRDYWATEQQRQKILAYERNNKLKKENEKFKKYNLDNLYKNRMDNKQQSTQSQTMQIVEYKQDSFITKILNKIKSFFRKNK